MDTDPVFTKRTCIGNVNTQKCTSGITAAYNSTKGSYSISSVVLLEEDPDVAPDCRPEYPTASGACKACPPSPLAVAFFGTGEAGSRPGRHFFMTHGG